MKINKETSFRELNDFLDYCENEKKSSPQTIYNYYRDLVMFFRYMKFIKGKSSQIQEIASISVNDIDVAFLKTIKTEDIHKYLDYLEIKKITALQQLQGVHLLLKCFFSIFAMK